MATATPASAPLPRPPVPAWPARAWAVEGAGPFGPGLAQFLAERGEAVREVHPRWTAQRRRSARRPGKSDRLDALGGPGGPGGADAHPAPRAP